MRLGWSRVLAAARTLVGFLFFSYHNDARSNKHQIQKAKSRTRYTKYCIARIGVTKM